MTSVFEPVDDVRRSFADAVVDAFGRRSGPRFALMLSGGQTARDCYEVLAATPGIDWSLVDVFVGDERFVPPDDVDSNARLIRESLLDRIGTGGFVLADADDGRRISRRARRPTSARWPTWSPARGST